MAFSRASSSLVVLALVSVAVSVSADGGWVDARSTFFGRDQWSLHNGACGFGYICPNRWSNQLAEGWDVAAVSDVSNLNTGSQCGTCLEVRCRDATFKDGYGATLERSGLCLDKSQSVKVKITDSCPCNYPPNAVSNKRWCCNDMPSLDMSQWALEKIVQDVTKWGVFAIQYRQISCDAQIADPAPQIANVPYDPHANMKPSSLSCSTQSFGTAGTQGPGSDSTYSVSNAKRAPTPSKRTPKQQPTKSYYKPTKSYYKPTKSYAPKKGRGPKVHHHTAAYFKRQARKKHHRGLLVATTPLKLLRMEVTSVINHIDSAWTPVLGGKASWISKAISETASLIGSTATCCVAPTRGSSCGFSAAQGVAEMASTLGWYHQRQGAALGAVSVSLIADKTVCEGPVIEGMGAGPVADAGQWDYYKMPLAAATTGCTTAGAVTGIRFTNEAEEPAQFCVDSLMLL